MKFKGDVRHELSDEFPPLPRYCRFSRSSDGLWEYDSYNSDLRRVHPLNDPRIP